MLMLGFSSGLPFFLSGNTLGYWLRDDGTTLAAIGFLSWVGLAYSLKFLWAPIIDRVDAPVFGRFGRRRGWMIAQPDRWSRSACSAIAVDRPRARASSPLGVLALVVAFSSSTQDIVVDAWRIEAASGLRRARAALLGVPARLPGRDPGHRRADPDLANHLGLAGLVRARWRR